MRICWTVSTYNRPHLLPRVIYAFEHQTYEDRCMLIYDDGGQYGMQFGDKWALISHREREMSLGAKRNMCLAYADRQFDGFDAFMPVDDDDIPLPWHTEAAAKALENADWSRPSVIISGRHITQDFWFFTRNYTGNRDDQTKNRLYHPAHAFRVEPVLKVGGYEEHLSGPEDQSLLRKLEAAGVRQADPCEFMPPSYIYFWQKGVSISSLLNSKTDPNGEKAWEKLGQKVLPPATLKPWVPPWDLNKLPIVQGIFPRPF